MSNRPTFFERNPIDTKEIIKSLYDRSKTLSIKEDAELMYNASILIGVLDAKVKSLMGNPDDDMHG